MSQNPVEEYDELRNTPDLEYGFVVGRYVTAIVDSPVDPDRLPDLRAIPGRVEFEPMQEVHLRGAPYPATVVQQVFSLQIDRQGYVSDDQSLGAPAQPSGAQAGEPYPEDTDNPLILNRPGLYLIAGVYKVRTVFRGVNDVSEFTINVTAEHTKSNPLDLTEQKPVVTPPGYVEVVRIGDRMRAETAAEQAEIFRDETRDFARTDAFLAFVQDAESARDEAEWHHESATSAQQASIEARDAARDYSTAAYEAAEASHEALAELNDQVAQATAQANRSKTEADRSETEADRSETEADRSETEADRSKTEADRSETEANRSKTEADRSETEADRAATEAGTSEQYSEVSRGHSEDSATSASASQTAAAESEASAVNSGAFASESEAWSKTAQVRFTIDPENSELGIIEFPTFLLSDDNKSVVVSVS